MSTYCWALLPLLLLSLNAASKDRMIPIEMIYANRCHILDLMNQRNYKDRSLDTTPVIIDVQCASKKGDTKIEELIDSSYLCWKKNEEVVLGEFIRSYAPYANIFRKFRYYIEDSITVAILISFLDYPDSRKSPNPRTIADLEKPPLNWVRDALAILTYKVYFNSLEKHSSEIIDRLSRCKEPELEKLKLLVLCKLPDTDRRHKRDSLNNRKQFLDSSFKVIHNSYDSALKAFDSALDKGNHVLANKLLRNYADSIRIAWKLDERAGLLKDQIVKMENIPLWVKARLGDTIAEQNILRGFRNNDGSLLKNYALNASFVWSEPCKKAFLNLFYKDIPICDRNRYLLCRSLHDSLLIYLARHHPNDPMFGNFLSYNRFKADLCKPELQATYFMEVAKWVKKNLRV